MPLFLPSLPFLGFAAVPAAVLRGVWGRFWRRSPAQSRSAHADWENVQIMGERIFLRPVSMDDAEGMFACAGDKNVTRFLPWEPAPNIESVRPFLTDQIGRRRRGESLAFAVVLKETGAFVGSTDLMKLHAGHAHGEAELGYILAAPFWGSGLMPEAARLTLHFAFTKMDKKRVSAYADTENKRSCRVLEKLGMTRTGVENRTVKREKRIYARYEIAKAAWEALQT